MKILTPPNMAVLYRSLRLARVDSLAIGLMAMLPFRPDRSRCTDTLQEMWPIVTRALVEARISRIKRCIGARLLTCKTESQQLEGVIIANLVNLWNSFGKAVCVKNP
ncbi:hypothetical protein OKW34_000090 [Paraburkholderia youngii]|uniref:hypothetical protein n=1 Tax=Paraburkholderia youngii TaxID=2782701 RepID=UPI003D1F1FDA